MDGILILLGILLVMYLLGKFAIEQGQRAEQHKKFMKDMENWERKHKTKTR